MHTVDHEMVQFTFGMTQLAAANPIRSKKLRATFPFFLRLTLWVCYIGLKRTETQTPQNQFRYPERHFCMPRQGGDGRTGTRSIQAQETNSNEEVDSSYRSFAIVYCGCGCPGCAQVRIGRRLFVRQFPSRTFRDYVAEHEWRRRCIRV